MGSSGERGLPDRPPHVLPRVTVRQLAVFVATAAIVLAVAWGVITLPH
jgi:hypothetical protein